MLQWGLLLMVDIPEMPGTVHREVGALPDGAVLGIRQKMPDAGTGRILVGPLEPREEDMWVASWEGEGEEQEEGSLKSARAWGPKVTILWWAFYMPSATKLIRLGEENVWVDLDEDLFNELTKDQ